MGIRGRNFGTTDWKVLGQGKNGNGLFQNIVLLFPEIKGKSRRVHKVHAVPCLGIGLYNTQRKKKAFEDQASV